MLFTGYPSAFNNTVLIQFGKLPKTSTEVTTTFPISFSDTYSISKNLGVKAYESGTVYFGQLGFYDLTKTNAKTCQQANHVCTWIAIGY